MRNSSGVLDAALAMGCYESARGLAHSRTLREVREGTRGAVEHRALPWVGGEPIADFGAFGVVGVNLEDFLVMLARETRLVELLRVEVCQ